MRITIVNSYFPPWRGGAETYVYNISKALAVRGHEITVISSSDPMPPGLYTEGLIRVKRLRKLTRIYGTPLLLGLKRALIEAATDIFHANFPSPYIAFTVAAVSLSRRIPAVLTWHNDLPAVTSGARILIEAHDRLVLPTYLRVYRRVISTSEIYAKKSRILNGLASVSVVPNGVDCARFRPGIGCGQIRGRFGLKDKFTLLFVGALTKWHGYKGLDVLLGAMSIALRMNKRLFLLVVGDGTLREEYCSMSRSLGLEGHVTFLGDVADEHLPQYYSAADVLVLPSKDMSEGFGLTLLEANASGKPCIASKVGGIPTVIQDGYNGLLVPPNDRKSLAMAILELADDREGVLGMGRNGRRVALRHDWMNVAKQTEKIYFQALK